jgi:hypothetical protein
VQAQAVGFRFHVGEAQAVGFRFHVGEAQAVGFRFHVGEAQVSGYMLLTSGASTLPTQTVTLHHGQG